MRRNQHYSVPHAKIEEAPAENYIKVMTEWPFLARLVIHLTSILQGRPRIEVVKRRLLGELANTLESGFPDLYDVRTNSVGEPLFQVLAQIKIQARVIDTSVNAVLWPEPHGYLRFLVTRFLPEVDQSVAGAMRYDFDFNEIRQAPVEIAVDHVSHAVQSALRVSKSEIEKTLSPYWRAAAVLHTVVTFTYGQVLNKAGGSAGNRAAPLSLLLPSLIRLYQLTQHVTRYWNSESAELIAEYSKNVHPIRPGQIEMVISGVQNLQVRGRIQELIQLAMADPLVALSAPPIEADWFELTIDAYLDQVLPYLSSRAMRMVRGEIQTLFMQDYATDLTVLPEIPAGLPVITLGIILVLAKNEAFIRQQRAVLQLVIDAEFSRNGARDTLHQAINTLESVASEFAELFLPGEDGPGTAWDYLARIEKGSEPASAQHRQRTVYLDSLKLKIYPAIRSFTESLIFPGSMVEVRKEGDEEFGTIKYGNLLVQGIKDPDPIDTYLESVSRNWKALGIKITNLMYIEQEKTR